MTPPPRAKGNGLFARDPIWVRGQRAPAGMGAGRSAGMARDIVRGAQAVPAASMIALAIGAAAFGAIAVGALAIGRLALGRVTVKRARFQALEVDELTVRKLRVR